MECVCYATRSNKVKTDSTMLKTLITKYLNKIFTILFLIKKNKNCQAAQLTQFNCEEVRCRSSNLSPAYNMQYLYQLN